MGKRPKELKSFFFFALTNIFISIPFQSNAKCMRPLPAEVSQSKIESVYLGGLASVVPAEMVFFGYIFLFAI